MSYYLYKKDVKVGSTHLSEFWTCYLISGAIYEVTMLSLAHSLTHNNNNTTLLLLLVLSTIIFWLVIVVAPVVGVGAGGGACQGTYALLCSTITKMENLTGCKLRLRK